MDSKFDTFMREHEIIKNRQDAKYAEIIREHEEFKKHRKEVMNHLRMMEADIANDHVKTRRYNKTMEHEHQEMIEKLYKARVLKRVDILYDTRCDHDRCSLCDKTINNNLKYENVIWLEYDCIGYFRDIWRATTTKYKIIYRHYYILLREIIGRDITGIIIQHILFTPALIRNV